MMVDPVRVSAPASTRNAAITRLEIRLCRSGWTFGTRLRVTIPPMERAVTAGTRIPDSPAPAATTPTSQGRSTSVVSRMKTVFRSFRSGSREMA